jgi:SAM-dependent methyltransferase
LRRRDDSEGAADGQSRAAGLPTLAFVVAKPRVIPDIQEQQPIALDRLYAERFPEEGSAAKAELWRTLYDAFFAAYVPADATVLDLGAGYCDLINAVRAKRRIAVDLNPDTPRFAAPGVEVLPLAIERVAERVAPSSVDVAFASNVLEHLSGSDALLDVLGSTRRVLRPGGQLIIVQPNVRVLGGAFWDFFDHTLPLSEKGMSEALLLAGFRIAECRARFLPYTTKSRLPQSAALVRAYLRLRPAQWLFGKQMLVVAERPR